MTRQLSFLKESKTLAPFKGLLEGVCLKIRLESSGFFAENVPTFCEVCWDICWKMIGCCGKSVPLSLRKGFENAVLSPDCRIRMDMRIKQKESERRSCVTGEGHKLSAGGLVKAKLPICRHTENVSTVLLVVSRAGPSAGSVYPAPAGRECHCVKMLFAACCSVSVSGAGGIRIGGVKFFEKSCGKVWADEKKCIPLQPQSERNCFRNVAQLVAHYVRDVGVGRSSRLIPTEAKIGLLRSSFFVCFCFVLLYHMKIVLIFCSAAYYLYLCREWMNGGGAMKLLFLFLKIDS